MAAIEGLYPPSPTGVPAELTAPTAAMGIVLLREAAPEGWRREARALLFAPGRPYFR